MQNLFQEMLLQIVQEWNEACKLTQSSDLMIAYSDSIEPLGVSVQITLVNDKSTLLQETMQVDPMMVQHSFVPIEHLKNEMLQQACRRLMMVGFSQGIDKAIRINKERQYTKAYQNSSLERQYPTTPEDNFYTIPGKGKPPIELDK